jgi:hypothetical protein
VGSIQSLNQFGIKNNCLSSVKESVVTALSKAWTVFARSNTGVVGSNPTRVMDVCVYSVLSCVCSSLAAGSSPAQGVYFFSLEEG